MSRHPWFDHPAPIPIAHRGGAGLEPENTHRAFRRAVELGFSWLETDVHATRDGVLVAFHDESLDRVTDGRGLIRELTWAEVSTARVAGTEPIPRLIDLLEEFPDARFSIDPKHDSSIDSLVEVVEADGRLDRLCFGAFSDRRLRELRGRLGPAACIGLGPRGLTALRFRSWRMPVPVPVANCAQPPRGVGPVPVIDERFVAEAHRRGMPVSAWTIDDPEEMHRLLDLRVDAIITDRPEVLRRVLRERDQWVTG